MTGRKPKKFTAFLWHRRIGLFAVVLVIILAITGIMLNHTEELELDETYVSNTWLLGWYGIAPEDAPVSYRAGEHIISSWNKQLFFDNHAIATLEQDIHGVMKGEEFIVVALDDAILLLSHEGEMIERVSTSISFSNIMRLGIKYQRPVIETADHLYYIADEHILDWDVMANEGVSWIEPYQLSSNEKDELLQAYLGKGLKLERVILDLHSGRIFGEYGIYLMDASAFALLWLSLSGFWVWNSRRRKMRRKRHYQKHHRKKP
ncbi:MAG TPA: hypothetical protein ENJ11_09875 [Gammaproteobacteria bacterium]|nr:hypothetical protein [Gammaproteobacteria bacterium]